MLHYMTHQDTPFGCFWHLRPQVPLPSLLRRHLGEQQNITGGNGPTGIPHQSVWSQSQCVFIKVETSTACFGNQVHFRINLWQGMVIHKMKKKHQGLPVQRQGFTLEESLGRWSLGFWHSKTREDSLKLWSVTCSRVWLIRMKSQFIERTAR